MCSASFRKPEGPSQAGQIMLSAAIQNEDVKRRFKLCVFPPMI